MALVKTQLGWIEVICGSMFSGKSEELIRRLRRAIIAKQRVQIFKPKIDSRYADAEIVSHSEMRLPSLSVASSDELVLVSAAQIHRVDADADAKGAGASPIRRCRLSR